MATFEEPAAHLRVDRTQDGVHVLAVGGGLDPVPDATVAAVRHVAQCHSTFYLANHGADSRIERLFEIARTFYALPLEERMLVAAAGAQQGGYHGRDRSTQSYVVNRANPELPHVFGENQWPKRPVGFPDAIEGYLAVMYPLAMRVLSAVSSSLGLPPRYFEPMFGDGAIQNLQLRYYDVVASTNPMPLAAHSDPPPITLIAQDEAGGLESLFDDRWVPVRPLSGTLVCQFGAMMARWTNDRYPASIHRVRATDGVSRCSLVYNLLPRPDALVESVPTVRAPSAPPPPTPVTVEAFLRSSLRGPSSDARERSADAARDDALPPEIVDRCRELVRMGSGGVWSLKCAARAGTAIRMDLAVRDQLVIMDLTRGEAGRAFYKSFGAVGVSYRGQIREPADLRALDQLLPYLVECVAPAFRVSTH